MAEEKKTMTIHFINGEKKVVSQEVVEALVQEMMIRTGAVAVFQSFKTPAGGTFLVLNVKEINYID
jgi:hypothetical protein